MKNIRAPPMIIAGGLDDRGYGRGMSWIVVFYSVMRNLDDKKRYLDSVNMH